MPSDDGFQPCLDPLPPPGNGFARNPCGGPLHRPRVETCASSLPRATVPLDPSLKAHCQSDQECTELPHGYCGTPPGYGPRTSYACQYGCTEDDECGEGRICVCGEPVGYCVASTCTSDAECGDKEFRCRVHASTRRCGELSFACETVQDQCRSDADCADDHVCVPTRSGFFLCSASPCAD
jgi:hypothetical protein